jgi:hypothetical protein
MRNKPSAEVLMVTPELAEQMLKTSTGNRKLRQWYVDLLASAMRRGEWRLTSQGAGFDEEGHLKDCHHRLTACVKSGVTIPLAVVYGLPLDAYEVIDTGMIRTYADRLNLNRKVADVVRLGCSYALGVTKPTTYQMKPYLDAGFLDVAESLLEFCGTSRKFYTSAPMKLAACITIINGGDPEYVLKTYRTLCLLDFDNMPVIGKALVRQTESGKSSAVKPRDAIARGLKVFDKDRSNTSKVQISDADADAAVALCKYVLNTMVITGGGGSNANKGNRN